jgi:hypothetical protein
MNDQGNPLILVFYVDRLMFMPGQQGQKPMINHVSQSVDMVIREKQMNAVAFFLPTSTYERIECINPAIVPQDAMDKINQMVKDIEKQFGIGGQLEDDGDEATDDTTETQDEADD